MGRPVVHFEIIGRDTELLGSFYSRLFDWEINADNPMRYGLIAQETNHNTEGDNVGIGGGIGACPEGHDGHVTFYVEVPDIEAALQQAEALGGERLMGPEKIMDGVVLGQFADPEGHVIGVVSNG